MSTTRRKTAAAGWLINLPFSQWPYLAPRIKWGKDDVVLVCTTGGRRPGRRRHGVLLGSLAKLSVSLPAVERKLVVPIVQHVAALSMLGGPRSPGAALLPPGGRRLQIVGGFARGMAGDALQAGFDLRHNAPNEEEDLLGAVPRSKGQGDTDWLSYDPPDSLQRLPEGRPQGKVHGPQ